MPRHPRAKSWGVVKAGYWPNFNGHTRVRGRSHGVAGPGDRQRSPRPAPPRPAPPRPAPPRATRTPWARAAAASDPAVLRRGPGQDRPIARAAAGNDAGTPIPAVRMPTGSPRRTRRCCGSPPDRGPRLPPAPGAGPVLGRPLRHRADRRPGPSVPHQRHRGPARYQYGTEARRRAPRTG
ncbi:hypothetical protein ACR6C2_37275 [Streptomyces sp. INA 01156]